MSMYVPVSPAKRAWQPAGRCSSVLQCVLQAWKDNDQNMETPLFLNVQYIGIAQKEAVIPPNSQRIIPKESFSSKAVLGILTVSLEKFSSAPSLYNSCFSLMYILS